MVYIPAGEFLMDSIDYYSLADNDEKSRHKVYLMADGDEKPQHIVYLDAFWIDKYPVTNAQYGKFLVWMKKTGDHGLCHPDEPPGKDHTPQYWDDPEWNAADKPVVGVDWYDAYAYAAWVRARLPTEAEWEKAARGTDGRLWPWGNKWDADKVNSWERGPRTTTAVGSYPAGASPYGALDMAGNVWEWVADWYDSDYYARSPGRNPPGPDSGQYRVLRGGSWDIYRYDVRCANRLGITTDLKFNLVGFRCARS
jgi:sulfatase modifying factor 1